MVWRSNFVGHIGSDLVRLVLVGRRLFSPQITRTVYKKTFTKPLPANAKIIVRKGQRLAEWKDAKGKTRTAALTIAGDRIAVEAGTYTAKYRDGSGIVREVATGCRDESAARLILGQLERRPELVKGIPCRCRKCLPRQTKQPADKRCQRVA